MKKIKVVSLCLTIVALFFMTGLIYAATFVVDSLGDVDNGSPYTAFDGTNTLRKCIRLANNATGTDTIIFGVSGTIYPTSALPGITNDGTTIDASSGWIGVWPGGEPGIILDGINTQYTNGLVIDGASNCHIRGLFITDFDDGILIRNGAQSNTIGGSTTGNRNIISGNSDNGVTITDTGTNNNVVSGNYIGTDANGTDELDNSDHGVAIWNDAQFNIIGGTTPGERNIISGNRDFGVLIEGADYNVVSGNYIGTDVNGTAALGNSDGGVTIWNEAHFNVIGGTTPGERNIISGNGDIGVIIEDDANNNVVSGNYIGTDVNGTAALGNSWMGVAIWYAQFNTIGGTTPGERNIISGNYDYGILIEDDANNNVVSGNYIGTDVTGTNALGNSDAGIAIEWAHSNTIGGATPGERNIISGNGYTGVFMDDSTNNVVSGNYIGTDVNGTAPLGNGEDGIVISDDTQSSIVSYNTIAYNNGHGILVEDEGTRFNRISRNSIHDNAGWGIRLDDDGNDEIHSPTIAWTDVVGNTLTVSGSDAGAYATLEVFQADSLESWEGMTYLPPVGGNTANANGDFLVSVDVTGMGISDNDPIVVTTTHTDNNTSEFRLNFSAPDIEVFPESWDYGEVLVPDGRYRDRIFSVDNEGSGTLDATMSIIQSGSHFINQVDSNFSVQPGDTYDILVRFQPSSLGDKFATLRFANNVTGKNPLDIPLQGTGVMEPTVVHVATTGNDITGNGSLGNPYRTIQSGIDAARYGNIVQAHNGIYTGTGNVNLDFWGKAITVRSANGATNCIIDCESVNYTRGFIFHRGEGSESVVEGFTIQNANTYDLGGGIYCEDSSPIISNNIIMNNSADEGGGIYCEESAAIIANNVISGNSADDEGGGIYCEDSTATITNNAISGNSADDQGGGIYCEDSTVTITSNTISGNSTSDEGGGIFCEDNYTVTITDNVISGNSASEEGGGIYCDNDFTSIASNIISGNSSDEVGGGIYLYSYNDIPIITNNVIVENTAFEDGGGIYCDSDAVIMNNTIARNSASWDGGGWNGGGIYCSYSDLTVTNTILWDNAPQEIYLSGGSSTVTVSYSDVQGGQAAIGGTGTVNWGSGNINLSPQFVDAANGDYHLRIQSPCTSAGTSNGAPPEDIDGNPRGTPPSIGAYENAVDVEDVTTLTVQAFSPVNLVITDPKGQVIDKDTSTIPGAVYNTTNLNDDGDPDVEVTIPNALLGDYSIMVTAKPGANPTDTYTIDINYGDEAIRLAEDVQVGDIPAESLPYVHFYPYRKLVQGWELISLPKQPGNTGITSVLATIEGKYDSVWTYDQSTGWQWYIPSNPPASNLSEMEARRGYWLMVNELCFLKVQGDDPDTAIPLSANWNLPGYCAGTYRDIEDCMASINGLYISVWEYDSVDEWRWYLSALPDASNLEFMRPGFGYWIETFAACTWDIGEGAPLAPPAIPVAGNRYVLSERPQMPYVVWGNVEVNGVKVTGATRDAPVALLKVNGEVVSSYRMGTVSQHGDSYALDVPASIDDSAQVELYVQMDGQEVKVDMAPPGRPGQVVRFDLSVQLAPRMSRLHQNFPNPFNPETWIPYQLKEDARVEVRIYALTGQLVRTLSLGLKPAGFYVDRQKAAYWDGRNEAGEHVASGVYFYSIKAGNLITTRKMVVAR